MDQLLIGTKEAAALLDMTEGTLRRWRSQGLGPPYVKVAATKVKYDVRDLEAWIADHRRGGGNS